MDDGMSKLARALAASGRFSQNRLLDQPAAPEPTPRNRLLSRSVSEDEVQFGFNPIDELRRTVNTRSFTPEQAAENRKQSLWEALSVIPGPGNVISAQDAYTGAGDAYDAFQAGDYKGGALASALAGLSGAGAVFGLPFGKFAKGAAEAGKDTLFTGLPMDDASRVARANGPDYDQQWWHGTAGDHTEFDPYYMGSVSSGDGRGFWFTKSPSYAWEYAQNASAKRGEPPRMMETRLSPKNPMTLNFDGSSRPIVDGQVMDFESNSDVINYARQNGYDSVYMPDGSFTDEAAMVIFDPAQIKIVD